MKNEIKKNSLKPNSEKSDNKKSIFLPSHLFMTGITFYLISLKNLNNGNHIIEFRCWHQKYKLCCQLQI